MPSLPYTACLFDVDKTLTNSHKMVTGATKSALQLLTQKGYHSGVCTGRNFATLHGFLQASFPSNALHIVCGGAQIITSTGEVLYERLMKVEAVEELMLLAEKEGCRLIVESTTSLYGNALAQANQPNYQMDGQQPAEVHPLSAVSVASVPLVSAGNVSDAFLHALEALPVSVKLMTNYQGKRYVDITAAGVNKATAVVQWCELQSLKPSTVIGFGDGLNDIEFLDTVGYAVAVANAPMEVQEHADAIALDCDHDGVAVWIQENL